MSHLLEGYLDFGAPGTGFHATRFLGLALYDTLAVLGVSIIIGLVRGWKIYMVFVVSILISVSSLLDFRTEDRSGRLDLSLVSTLRWNGKKW